MKTIQLTLDFNVVDLLKDNITADDDVLRLLMECMPEYALKQLARKKVFGVMQMPTYKVGQGGVLSDSKWTRCSADQKGEYQYVTGVITEVNPYKERPYTVKYIAVSKDGKATVQVVECDVDVFSTKTASPMEGIYAEAYNILAQDLFKNVEWIETK